MFRAERFRTYIYGRCLTIESDHKPLESTSQKNLADTPAWLQWVLLHLQGCEYILHYCPGKEMALSDALSHFSPCPGPNIPLYIAIHHARLCPDWKEAFQQAFVSDAEIYALLASSLLVGQLTSRRFIAPYVLTSNIMRPSSSKMVLFSMEKPSFFLLQKGRENYTNYTSFIKESPNPSCSRVDVSFGLA